MAEPFKLTLADVKAKAKKAYLACSLTAQDPIREYRKCQYRNESGCNCAVGVALPPDVIDHIKKRGFDDLGVGVLNEYEIVKIDPGELDDIRKIQRFHDSWCRETRHKNITDEYCRNYERLFARAIGIKC
jgi:hypothetical protein